MTSASDISAAFATAQKHLRWAKDAVDELDREFGRFVQDDPTRIVIENELDSRWKALKIKVVKPLPDILERKATESLLNTKHSYDQAIAAAIRLVTKTRTKVHFPWADSPSGVGGLLKSIPKELWDVVKGREPYLRSDAYPGGNNDVRNLAKLANTKHDIGISLRGHAISVGKVGGFIRQSQVLTFPRRWDAEKNEIVVARYIGEIDFDPDYEFGLQILFDSPRLPEPINAIDGLDAFLEHANITTQKIEARCRELLL